MKIEKLCINCMQERRSPDGICEFCGFDVRTFELPRHHMRPFTRENILSVMRLVRADLESHI